MKEKLPGKHNDNISMQSMYKTRFSTAVTFKEVQIKTANRYKLLPVRFEFTWFGATSPLWAFVSSFIICIYG